MSEAPLTDELNAAMPFEIFDRSWRDSPTEAYQRLLEGAPVYQAPSGHWVLSRYADVRASLAAPDLFSSGGIDEEAHGIPRSALIDEDPEAWAAVEATFHGIDIDRSELATVHSVLGADGAEHVRQRKLIDRAFSPARVRALHPTMDQISAELAAKAADADRFDAMQDLGYVLPRRIIGELLSVETEHQADLTRWAAELMGAASGADRHTQAARNRLMATLREFASFFVPRINARRANPSDDFLSDLVRAESEDRLTSLEILLLIRVVMVAGTDTTANLIGNTIVELMRDRDKLAQLQADPSLVPAALEESLRYWAPFYFLIRETTRDVEIGGKTIPKDSFVAVFLAAANHDSSEFSCPAHFDIARSNKHLAFGFGTHFCVGSHLARAEALSAITAVLPYLDRFELTDEPLELAESQLLQGYVSVPLVARK